KQFVWGKINLILSRTNFITCIKAVTLLALVYIIYLKKFRGNMKMGKILAINAGSSSLKFQLFEMPSEEVLAKGLTERIGTTGSEFTLEVGDNEEYVSKSVLITDEVIEKIEEVSELAPLHNPPNLTGIAAFKDILPDTPMVAVFDTAFHQTMPEKSYIYSLPYDYYEKYGIRKYGFHGTSHKYVSQKAAELLERPLDNLRLITCHLGNGASITAVENGKSIDTSMGFTPLAGVTMGTRSGDIDPAIIPFIKE